MFIIFMIIVVLLLVSSARSNKKVKKMHKRYYKRQKLDGILATMERETAQMRAYNERKKAERKAKKGK